MDRNVLNPIVIALLVLLLIVGGYFGAYYLSCSPGLDIVGDPQSGFYSVAEYRPDLPVLESVFQPAHLLDRQVRHEYWTVDDFMIVPFEQWDSDSDADEFLVAPDSSGDGADVSVDNLRQGTQPAADVLERKHAILTAEIDLDPQSPEAYLKRGEVNQQLGDWQAALADFEQARELNSGNAAAWENAARLLAACPDDEIRNSAKAVEYAQKACQLTEWNNADALAALAIAYAELGDWQAATDICDEQLAKLSGDPDAAQFEELRALFVEEQPFRIASSSVIPDFGTWPGPENPQVTATNYQQLRKGMTLEDVEAILGPGSKEPPPDDLPWRDFTPGGEAPNKIFRYWWSTRGYIVVGFVDGELDYSSTRLHQ